MTTTAVTSPDTGTMHDGSIQVPQHMTQLAAAGAREPTFVVKLHTILSNSDLSNIIAWLPHGRSWRIFDQTAFEKQVIPLYFQHGHFPSFTRQVSGWGFRRVLMGDDANSYHHKVGCSSTTVDSSFLRYLNLPTRLANLG